MVKAISSVLINTLVILTTWIVLLGMVFFLIGCVSTKPSESDLWKVVKYTEETRR